MAKIKLTVDSNFQEASADIKRFGTVTEAQRKKIEKYIESFKPEAIDNFVSRQSRATAAVKATRGPVAAAKTAHRAYQRQIETLIRNGIDPEDKILKELKETYSKLETQIEKTTREQERQQRQTERNEKALKALKIAAIAGGVAMARAFVDFSKEAAEAASIADEISGKYGVVFRELENGGDNMAKNLAEDFDLASSTAKELLGNTGDLLTGFGLSTESAAKFSDETNRLALDLASFTNAQGGAAAVSKALTSAYANEREALKTYGIVISQAMVDARLLEDAQKGLTFESEKEAIAFATLSLATEQSKNAIGDYARTADTTANIEKTLNEQIKRSKENWGALINEGITPVRRAFRDFLKEMNDLEEDSRNLDDALEGVAGADLERAIRGQQEALSKAIKDRDKLLELGRGESELAEKRVLRAQENLDILNRELEAQKQSQGYSAILKSLEDEKAAAAAKTAEELAEQQKWTNMRKDAEADLLIKLQKINDTEKLSMSLGKEYNSEQERSKAVWETINRLREEGFSVEGNGIQNILDKYGNLFVVYESLGERLTELNDLEAEKQLENIETFQTFLDARMAQEEISGEDRILFLKSELARIKSLETVSNKEKVAAEKATNKLILSEMTKQAVIERKEREKEFADEDAMSRARIELRKKEFDIIAGFYGNLSALIKAFAGENREAAIAAKALAHAQAAINSYLAFTQVLADPTLPFFLKAVSAASTLAAGIAQQVNIAKTPIPSAQTGTGATGIEVARSGTSSQADNVPVMVSEGETVTVGARGESGGGAGTMNAIFQIGEEELFRVINIGIESGDVRITQDNIQGGTAV